MSRAIDRYDRMSLDDFEDLLLDRPHDEKWELIGGRCGPLPAGATSVDDPIVLIEVMSAGTAGRDRGEKWRVYRKLASLQHDVLVDRDEALVEVFDRQGDAWASLRTLEGLHATLELPALTLSLPLAEIYADVLSA